MQGVTKANQVSILMRAIKLPTRRPNRVNLVRDQAIERQIRALELIAERLGIIEKNWIA